MVHDILPNYTFCLKKKHDGKNKICYVLMKLKSLIFNTPTFKLNQYIGRDILTVFINKRNLTMQYKS